MGHRWYGNDIKLGVLGGGQLGRMMIQSAISFDIHIHCLDPDPNAPCAEIAHSFTCGSITDYETVMQFGADKDVITVEIENVNIEALKALQAIGKKVYPQPEILEVIKDKGLQKQFYLDQGLPTAPFDCIVDIKEAKEQKIPFVHKLRTGGYDGKGVNIIRTSADLETTFNGPSIIEQLVPFKKELSSIVARNERGEIAVFPLVECEFDQEANLVSFLFSPADVKPSVEQEAIKIAQSVIEKLEMVGLLAVEFFLTEDDTLLINEIAPRPHNSGHHTIECCRVSQFEQHLRAILNLPLGDTTQTRAGAMINLVGEKGHEGPVLYKGLEDVMRIPGVYPHLYGKQLTKPFRKMGHITVTGESVEEVREKAQKVMREVQVLSIH
jgi:5-(carboxyamino)imidazole ribonucleotide synthase